jgi:hypothetical protein
MSRLNRRNHPHHYAAEPIVCVAEYPLEQQDSRVRGGAAVLIGVLLWAVFCIA